MNIGLYFGSFNPLHNGHTALAKYFLETCEVEEVWLVLSPNNPLKQNSELWDERLRLHLARLALADYKNIKVTDIEFSLPRPSYTINTLQALSAEYPQHRFSLLIGSDNMARFDKWKDYDVILKQYTIYVYPRRGDNIETLSKKYPEMSVLANVPYYDISSTQIRRMLSEGKDISGLVDKRVANYIKENIHTWS